MTGEVHGASTALGSWVISTPRRSEGVQSFSDRRGRALLTCNGSADIVKATRPLWISTKTDSVSEASWPAEEVEEAVLVILEKAPAV